MSLSALMFILPAANQSLAECVLSNPKEYVIAVAEQPPDESPAIECRAFPIAPCTVPNTPTIVGSVKAQEVTIRATIPNGYTTKSTAVIRGSGSTVQIGLPGLRKDTMHWVSVGSCRNITGNPGLKGSNCGNSGTGSVFKCDNVCCLLKSDDDIDRLSVEGQFSLFGHHVAVRYKLEWVRFGDASTGSWP